MPKFSVEMLVTRTIIQTKRVEIEVEADDTETAEALAAIEAEKNVYHNIEDQNWDLDEISSEGSDFDITAEDEDADDE